MNEIAINEIPTLDSREVAEMIGKEHNELLKDIRTYIEYLAEGDFPLGDFFLESSYFDGNNQERPCYLLTKKGCELVGNSMTGAKGVQFTVIYVQKFNEMEEVFKKASNNMNELQIVEQREVLGRDFKIYGDFENPLFLAKDVAEWIEYNKTSQGYYDTSAMLRVVEDDEKCKIRTTINNPSGSDMWFLTEDGLYEVLMQSRKPIAKQFKKQVKAILKEIRQTGSYSIKEVEETDIITHEQKFKLLDLLANCPEKTVPVFIEMSNKLFPEFEVGYDGTESSNEDYSIVKDFKGFRLNNKMQDLDLSNKDLADAIGVAESTVAAWRNGGKIKKVNLEKLNEYFNVKDDYFTTNKRQRVQKAR